MHFICVKSIEETAKLFINGSYFSVTYLRFLIDYASLTGSEQ